MVIEFVLVQPAALDPVTVYVVVTLGVTTVDAPVAPPGVQVYVLALLPNKVVDDPIQTAFKLALTPTLGNGLTVTVVVAVLEQPKASVPVTV
jgi:hypothetical protein